VVGWWATWPAERVHGTVVTDRLYATLTSDLSPALFRVDPPHMVFPAAATERFVAMRASAVGNADWARVAGFMDVSQAAFDRAVSANAGMADPVDGFRRILASTATYFEATFDLAKERPDLLMTYIQGTDEINHVLAPYVDPPTIDVDPADAARLAAAVPRYFEHVDRLVGRLLELCPPSEYAVLLVSDHGTRWGADRPRDTPAWDPVTAALWHSPDAVFVVAGRGVAPGGRQEHRASVYDVAPTVLALLGLPPGSGWRGGLLPGIVPSPGEPLEYEELLPVESYRPDAGDGLVADPEYLANLRALGYLAEDAAPPRLSIGAAPADGFPRTATPSALNNLGLIALAEKRYDLAERALRAAVDRGAGYAAPHNNLHDLYMETGRLDDADRELWTAIEAGANVPEARVDRAVTAHESAGREDRAIALLTEAARRFPHNEGFWMQLLRLKMARRECPEARRLAERAVAALPDAPALHAVLGMAAGCTGDLTTARRELERSLALDPDQPEVRRILAGLPGAD
jgi:Flp pilus assembly protein TadD